MARRKPKINRKCSIIESSQDPTPFEVYRAALAYLKAGLSFIPIATNRKKEPAFKKLPQIWNEYQQRTKPSWVMYQNRQPTTDEIRHWFRPASKYLPEYGIAIVGGQVSGGLEILDLDTYDLVEPFQEEVNRRSSGLFDRLVAVRTPRPGLHLYYRCERVAGSQKLARVKDSSEAGGKWTTVIETKGEGGYCLAPPSPDWCHPREACYVFEGDKDLTKIPTITTAERAMLLDAARSFDRFQTARPQVRRSQSKSREHDGVLRPGDEFNARAAWADILQPHGWSFVGNGGGGEEQWVRPGKLEGCSATTNYAGADLLYVFTQNADPFEADQAYSKFQAFALLECDGDFAEAARELCRRGYGERRSPQPAKRRPIPARSNRLRRKFR